ncbi:DUF6303 family protein [Streptomyces sp. P9-2B-2]|uniref:DUF6303 family protein n=1 Tax=Streptomyces sp. P9-2B-2 TaxID=3057114 RepID=UPI0025B47F48|nr:DUF6303 family protein [Streptomyces sp. P9-2B-2]WJY39738.1 DUF6303 family protein [Streptomyces sp. P9-2B-2]
MGETFTAQMAAYGPGSGAWRLYVVRFGESDWPEHNWARTTPVPTPVERAEALADLGYEVAGAEWEWLEYSTVPDDPASPVRLLAAVSVRATTGGGVT